MGYISNDRQIVVIKHRSSLQDAMISAAGAIPSSHYFWHLII